MFQSGSLTTIHLDDPTSLRAFFAREIRHGMAMFVLPRWPLRDLATVGTIAHAFLVLLAVVSATVPFPVAARAALAAALLTVVPAATVARRAIATRRLPRPVTALVLYECFYMARLVSLVALAWRALRRAVRKRGAAREAGEGLA